MTSVSVMESLGSAGVQTTSIPRIASGEVRVAVGFAGSIGQTGVARAAFDGKRLSGRVQGVLDGGGATLVAAVLGRRPGASSTAGSGRR